MARKGGKAYTELIRPSQRRKSVYQAKTCPEKAETFFREKANTRLNSENGKAETRLPSWYIPHKGENVYLWKTCPGKAVTLFTERKRRKQRRKRVYQGKTCLSSENAFPERKRGSQSFKRVYRAKTFVGKAKKPLPSENIARKGENFLPSENNVCKGENVFTERKHDNRAKTPLPSEEVPRKGKNAFNERKCGSQSWKGVYRENVSRKGEIVLFVIWFIVNKIFP